MLIAQLPTVDPGLWTSSFTTALAIFLLYTQQQRDNKLRAEALTREERMAHRIDSLEADNRAALQIIVEWKHALDELRNAINLLNHTMQANCAACEARRDEILHAIRPPDPTEH